MKAFIIIMLSLAILFKLAHFINYTSKLIDTDDDETCLTTIIDFILLIGYILALIFACQLH